jgi:hypothetical protein
MPDALDLSNILRSIVRRKIVARASETNYRNKYKGKIRWSKS